MFAFYLPQFHPIPENDAWWGKGFTEWTNVGKATPLFPGHYQPKVPADLGYYDLRVPETRVAQAELAKEYGIEGFIYWHYWFGEGKRLLERPFSEVLSSGSPDFPFALAWANESWRGFYHGLNNERDVLITQKYLGESDYKAHFFSVLNAFKDKRYISVEGKPMFMVYQPLSFPDIKDFIKLWNSLAKENGLDGIFFVAMSYDKRMNDTLKDLGFNGICSNNFNEYIRHSRPFRHRILAKLIKFFYGCPQILFYDDIVKHLVTAEDEKVNVFPTLYPNWDHSPRTGKKGIIVIDSNPKSFSDSLKTAIKAIDGKPRDKQIIFIKSWNEWAEGNYLEPDLKYRDAYLQAVRDNIL